MKVIYGFGNFDRGPRGPKVLTVGVFDGVHRGHQAILNRVRRRAARLHMKSAVVTFAMHPASAIKYHPRVAHLSSLEHKIALLSQTGIDVCYVIDFTRTFARMSAMKFVRDVLLGYLRMAALYVGEDFVFGRGARGNVAFLRRCSKKMGFDFGVVPHVTVGRRVISSTLIRALARRGDLRDARRLLGRPVSLWGEVIPGEGRGRRLGFPTANIRPHHDVLVPDGIYATQARYGTHVAPSVTYVGRKPTFHPRGFKRGVEVFLFTTAGRLYGRTMEIRFLKRLRRDRKFPSPEALVAQMGRDCAAAKKAVRALS